MMQTPRHFVVALALAGGLSACGSKDKSAEQAAPPAATATPPTETAATPAAPVTETPAAPAAADATFDLSAVPVSTAALGRFPYLGRLQGYKLNVPSDSVDFEFDRNYIYDGKNIVPVEGRVLRRSYIVANDQKKTSVLMMQRNYENLVKSLGGVKVWSGELPNEAVEKLGSAEFHKHNGNIDPNNQVDTYVIRQKDKEIWVQLRPDDYRYYLNVIERAAMPQRVSALKADELKKN